MTVLAFCGPIGSDLKAISEQCFSLLNKECTLIDSSTYTSIDSLLSVLEKTNGDVIVFGPDIFLDEKLRSKFDIKVFLELDSDLCLSRHLRLVQANELNAKEHIDYYFSRIQPLNDKIRVSAKFADLRRPQASSNEKLIDLFIDRKGKDGEEITLKKTLNSNAFLSKDMFWNSAHHQQSPISTQPTSNQVQLI